MGFNFWQYPLKKNTVFIEDLKTLIEKNQITEMLFGNCLKKA